MNKIEIQGITYPIKFGLNAVRSFCLKRKIEFHEYQKQLSSISQEGMTIQQMDDIALLIQCAVAEGIRKEKSTLQVPELEDLFEMFESPEESQKAFSLFADSQPETDTEPTEEKNQNSLKVVHP